MVTKKQCSPDVWFDEAAGKAKEAVILLFGQVEGPSGRKVEERQIMGKFDDFMRQFRDARKSAMQRYPLPSVVKSGETANKFAVRRSKEFRNQADYVFRAITDSVLPKQLDPKRLKGMKLEAVFALICAMDDLS